MRRFPISIALVCGLALTGCAYGDAPASETEDDLGSAESELLFTCSDRVSNWIYRANIASQATNDECTTAWSTFPATYSSLTSSYYSIRASCTRLSVTQLSSMDSALSALNVADTICDRAIACHDAVNAYAAVTSQLQQIVDGGCLRQDYWDLALQTSSLFSQAYSKCFDINRPKLWASVSPQFNEALDQEVASGVCSSDEYGAARCWLDSTVTVNTSATFLAGLLGCYDKTAVIRDYRCRHVLDKASCRQYYPVYEGTQSESFGSCDYVNLVINQCELAE